LNQLTLRALHVSAFRVALPEPAQIYERHGLHLDRSTLADSYDVAATERDIQVVDVDSMGDRPLILRHTVRNGVGLAEAHASLEEAASPDRRSRRSREICREERCADSLGG